MQSEGCAENHNLTFAGQMWCILTCVRTDTGTHANTHKHCRVSILACPSVAESSIPKRSEFQSDSARIPDWSTQGTLQQVPQTRCLLTLAPFSDAFFSPTSCRLLIPSCLWAFLILRNCVGRLGNPFKSFLYWDGTLQQGSYSHHPQTHTHMQGGLTQGRPTCILGQETDSSRITPPPPHMNSLNIHREKKNPTQHIVPFPLWAPICGWLRNSMGVIWLSLYKHAARKKERGRRKGTDQVRNLSNSLQKDKKNPNRRLNNVEIQQILQFFFQTPSKSTLITQTNRLSLKKKGHLIACWAIFL